MAMRTPTILTLAASVLLIGASTRGAMAEEPRVQVGGQAMLTVEPFEDGDTAFAFNVLPIFVEVPLGNRIGVRGVTLLNYQFAGEETGLAHRGLSLSMPIYLGSGPIMTRTYVGPTVMAAEYPQVDGADVTTGVEGGLRWKLASRVALNLVLQVGATRFIRPGEDRWNSHFGVYPGVGYWF